MSEEPEETFEEVWDAIRPPRLQPPSAPPPPPLISRVTLGDRDFESMGFHNRQTWINVLPSCFPGHSGWMIHGFQQDREKVYWTRRSSWILLPRANPTSFRSVILWTLEELDAQVRLAIANKEEDML